MREYATRQKAWENDAAKQREKMEKVNVNLEFQLMVLPVATYPFVPNSVSLRHTWRFSSHTKPDWGAMARPLLYSSLD